VWSSIPLWVCLLLIGREFAMTLLRACAGHKGVVIPASSSGKIKASLQNVFIGGTLAWFAFRDAFKPLGLEGTPFGQWWTEFHGRFVAATLGIALTLTLWSFAGYVVKYRRLLR